MKIRFLFVIIRKLNTKNLFIDQFHYMGNHCGVSCIKDVADTLKYKQEETSYSEI
jgi:hypothetical protein